ncbi:MAG: hypothetical protein ACKO96_19495, partial [Flammeovirgaceae bacterium]
IVISHHHKDDEKNAAAKTMAPKQITNKFDSKFATFLQKQGARWKFTFSDGQPIAHGRLHQVHHFAFCDSWMGANLLS